MQAKAEENKKKKKKKKTMEILTSKSKRVY
jgi:hypothetical protein